MKLNFARERLDDICLGLCLVDWVFGWNGLTGCEKSVEESVKVVRFNHECMYVLVVHKHTCLQACMHLHMHNRISSVCVCTCTHMRSHNHTRAHKG